MIFELLRDLLLTTRAIPPESIAAGRLLQIMNCLRSNLSFLITHPTAMAQSLENHVGESFRGAERPWLRSLIPANTRSERSLTFSSPPPNDAITACSLSPIHCFAGYRDGLIRGWRIQDGKLEIEWTLYKDDGPIVSLSTDSEGAVLASISINGG